jgi:hypothetical protein
MVLSLLSIACVVGYRNLDSGVQRCDVAPGQIGTLYYNVPHISQDKFLGERTQCGYDQAPCCCLRDCSLRRRYVARELSSKDNIDKLC